jgi:nanoRNase/pAp phosphatase (c-di-AMP/oligoRNAs hydrolase)
VGRTTPQARLEKFLEVLHGRHRPLFVCHNNPDPDSLASSFALRFIVEKLLGIQSVIGYAGIIGRAENRALVRYLGEGIEHLSRLDMEEFDVYALIDTQPGAGNNSFPPYLKADVIIDHHPRKCRIKDIAFVDIRDAYGATATMVAEYVRTAGVKLTPRVATALFYAIKTDTGALVRGVSGADKEMYVDVFSQVDLDALAQIENATLPESYFKSLYAALNETYVAEGHCVSSLGTVDNPDMVAELADFLLRLEEVQWVIAAGLFQNELIVSLRSREPGARAEKIIKRIVGKEGTAGGHGSMAGGQLPLGEYAEEEEKRVLEKMHNRIVSAFGLQKATWRRILAETGNSH